MSLKYIIRLDDACPTNDLNKWSMFERALDKLNIKPIVCVIPENQDEVLFYAPKDEMFWQRVKRYQDKGWHIALHGYSHKYNSKKRGLVPINAFSEFAGVTIEIQREKIRSGYKLLLANGIKPTIWVAPAHTFDKNTLKVLKEETDIRIISDGLAFYPYNDFGFFWIPQQLWEFFPRRVGVWTICTHLDMDGELRLQQQIELIQQNHHFFDVSISELQKEYGNRKREFSDYLFRIKFFLSLDKDIFIKNIKRIFGTA
jgi:predicted deacetylase